MQANDKTKAAVMCAIGRFAEAYAARDVDAAMAVFARDTDLIVIGTGVDERCVGPADFEKLLERDWSQSEAASIEIGWHSVSAAGAVAWAAAEATIHATVGGQDVSLKGRLTTVLEQRGDEWLIVQMHVSLPAAGQDEGESWVT